MIRRSRLAAALAVVLTSATLLAACSQPLPAPHPDAVPAAVPPALSTDQAERVLAAVHESLAAADAQLADGLLAPRVDGPAAAVRRAEYRMAAAGDATAITALPTGAQTLALPTTDAWPRTMMVVTDPPEDLQAPLLLTLVQETPRSPYYLWSWARLFPGVQTPPMAQPEVGSAPVDPDSAEFVASPNQVVAEYLDILANRDQSPYLAAFTDDPLRQAIWQTRDAFVGVVGANGTLAETYQPAQAGVRALATADGRALVVGTFKTTTTITLTDSTLKIGDQTAALLGTDTVASNLSIVWFSVVAFAVPPVGSDEQIQVLGAEHSRIEVTGQ